MSTKPSHQTVRRLTYFAAIAQAGSIRGAASSLGLSVPVVSAALSELEEELNVTLAVRTTRSFALTKTGEQVSAAARKLLAAAGAAMDAAGGRADADLSGSLSLSLTTEMAAHWLPPHLARFRKHFPNVTLHVDARDDVVTLKSSIFDLAIRAYGPRHPALDTGLGQIPLQCVSKSIPELRYAQGGWTVDAPLLTASGTDPVLQAWEPTNRIELPITFAETIVVTNRDAARKMALSGLGVALLLGIAVEEDIAQTRLLPLLPELSFGVVSYDVVMRDTLPSREARAFADLLRQTVSDRP